MNILFYLKPKEQVSFIEKGMSVRQALEKMETHKFSSVPILDSDRYLGTLSAGDLLWYIKQNGVFDLRDLEKVNIMAVKRNNDNKPVHIDATIDELLREAEKQNFVPVLDDRGYFIGIVTRSDLMNFLRKGHN